VTDPRGKSDLVTADKRKPKRVSHRWQLKVGIATASGGLLIALIAGPVMAEISHLMSIPLGRGTATITWVGKGGIEPTVNSIAGKAGGLSVSATDKVPKIPGTGGVASGSSSVPSSIPSTFPIADVKGTLDGSQFSLVIALNLSRLSGSSTGSLGSVSGTFRNQKMRAIITSDAASNAFDFSGSIGSLHVSGTINSVTHHRDSATAHASFDVTK
jgi:hypothetical protein